MYLLYTILSKCFVMHRSAVLSKNHISACYCFVLAIMVFHKFAPCILLNVIYHIVARFCPTPMDITWQCAVINDNYCLLRKIICYKKHVGICSCKNNAKQIIVTILRYKIIFVLLYSQVELTHNQK